MWKKFLAQKNTNLTGSADYYIVGNGFAGTCTAGRKKWQPMRATSAGTSSSSNSHRAFGAPAKIKFTPCHDNSTSHIQSITHHVSHIKTLPRGPHTSKFVCSHLLVATAIWRTVIHCLLYDDATYAVCWPGVEFPPLHIYLSV